MNAMHEHEALPVHLASVGPGVSMGTPTRPKGCAFHRHRPVFRTVNLTSAEPTQELVPDNDGRCYVLAQAGAYDVVIALKKGDAQNGANQVSGLPAPQGFVLTAGNTVPVKIPGGHQLHASAAQYPAQITLIAVYKVED